MYRIINEGRKRRIQKGYGEGIYGDEKVVVVCKGTKIL